MAVVAVDAETPPKVEVREGYGSPKVNYKGYRPMIVLVWALNLFISWLNAWGCGKTWNETKHAGGFPHFMNWMGATMAACGFTWCYMVVVAMLGSVIPVGQGEGLPDAPLVTQAMLSAFADLGYLVIIGPVLGSGLAITLHAWGVAYRERSFGSGAIAAYDTWAMIYNIKGAMDYVPEATRGLGSFLKSDDSDDAKGAIVVALVGACLAGGVLTTRAIIRVTARETAFRARLLEPDRPVRPSSSKPSWRPSSRSSSQSS